LGPTIILSEKKKGSEDTEKKRERVRSGELGRGNQERGARKLFSG